MERQRKVISCEIKEINEEDRSFLAVASTEDIDRDGDRFLMSGWQLDNFLKNPVIPWVHNYRQPTVAKATEIYVEGGKLMFRPKFATKEDYPFADTIFRLYVGGFLRAFSVGFDPKRYEIVERDIGKGEKRRGYDFIETELWEISACVVPANPNALIAAKQKGVITEDEFQKCTGPECSPEPETVNPEPDDDICCADIDELIEQVRLDATTQSMIADKQFRLILDKLKKTNERIDNYAALADPAGRAKGQVVEQLTRAPEEISEEDDDSKTQPEQTLSLDMDQVAEIARVLAKTTTAKVKEIVDKQIKHYLGIVE